MSEKRRASLPGSNPDDPLGLRCRVCNCAESEVVYTQLLPNIRKRKRVCRHCGNWFFTFEVTNPDALTGKNS